MYTFFSDLDNTLIYSYRKNITEKKHLVEKIGDCDQGYMTDKTYHFLKEEKWYELVPVTTRTQKQYERIFFFQTECRCHYALICNGGVLLIDGEPDKVWEKETQKLILPAQQELQWLEEYFASGKIVEKEHFHKVENLFLYLVSDEAQRIQQRLEKEFCLEEVVMSRVHRKLYFLPKALSKGRSIERFKHRFPVEKSVSAGDSEMDLSMLNACDYAFVPEKLASEVKGEKKILTEEIVLSDSICQSLMHLHQKGVF